MKKVIFSKLFYAKCHLVFVDAFLHTVVVHSSKATLVFIVQRQFERCDSL